MTRRAKSTTEPVRRGPLARAPQWNGVRAGDAVCVDLPRERRQSWVFVAHVLNEESGEEWVEVRGGRAGEAKGRSFRTEVIYPASARRGARLRGHSLAVAPMLPIP